jgi:hypothetical protein
LGIIGHGRYVVDAGYELLVHCCEFRSLWP